MIMNAIAMPGLKKNVIYVSNYLELQGDVFFAFGGKKILIENFCKRFHFKRDIPFQKVEIYFTFLIRLVFKPLS